MAQRRKRPSGPVPRAHEDPHRVANAVIELVLDTFLDPLNPLLEHVDGFDLDLCRSCAQLVAEDLLELAFVVDLSILLKEYFFPVIRANMPCTLSISERRTFTKRPRRRSRSRTARVSFGQTNPVGSRPIDRSSHKVSASCTSSVYLIPP